MQSKGPALITLPRVAHVIPLSSSWQGNSFDIEYGQAYRSMIKCAVGDRLSMYHTLSLEDIAWKFPCLFWKI
jgi:hypothetical protein